MSGRIRRERPVRFFVFVLLFFFATAVPSFARVYIDIDSPTLQKFPIAVVDFKNLDPAPRGENLGSWFADTLAQTLQLTGFFNIIQKNAFLAAR